MTQTRQQTLRASLDWSYALLPEAEQAVFRRLGVFTGGCRLEAAETVCVASDDAVATPPASMFDLMTGLVDKSLVVMDAHETAAWYRLLVPVHQYAQGQLEVSGEGLATRQRHGAFYLELAERAAQQLHGPAQLAWLARLDRERDNLRSALSWAQTEPNVEMLTRLTVALVPFWEVRGPFGEGRRWLEEALHGGADRLALWQAGLDTALDLFEQSVALARQVDHRPLLAEALSWVGTTYRRQGGFERADEVLRDGFAQYEALEESLHPEAAAPRACPFCRRRSAPGFVV
jgi:hypothetical protein